MIPQAKRQTINDELLKIKRRIPGPPAYDNTGLKQKVQGFYGNIEVKYSVLASTAYEKKYIPGPNVYESRGKSMSDLLKEKAKKFAYAYTPDPNEKHSVVKWKKVNGPAPTSYEWQESREKTSIMPNAIKNTIPKTKNSTFLSKSLFLHLMFNVTIDHVMRKNKHVPGVGSYQTLTTYKQLSSIPRSLKMVRH